MGDIGGTHIFSSLDLPAIYDEITDDNREHLSASASAPAPATAPAGVSGFKIPFRLYQAIVKVNWDAIFKLLDAFHDLADSARGVAYGAGARAHNDNGAEFVKRMCDGNGLLAAQNIIKLFLNIIF